MKRKSSPVMMAHPYHPICTIKELKLLGVYLRKVDTTDPICTIKELKRERGGVCFAEPWDPICTIKELKLLIGQAGWYSTKYPICTIKELKPRSGIPLNHPPFHPICTIKELKRLVSYCQNKKEHYPICTIKVLTFTRNYQVSGLLKIEYTEVIEDRHGKDSTIMASQLPAASCFVTMSESTVADAILSRLVHTSRQIEWEGETLRKKR